MLLFLVPGYWIPKFQVNPLPMNGAMVNCFLQRLNKENDFEDILLTGSFHTILNYTKCGKTNKGR